MSREKILKDMDKNSKFFHAKAAVRIGRKLMLEVSNGRRIFCAPRLIKMVARNFYRDLYKQKPMPNIYFPYELVNKISVEEANLLEQIPSYEEVKQAIWACESSIALDPDWYNFNFVKKSWHLIGDDFIACIKEFFKSCTFPSRANMTWVTFISKFEDAREMKDFRPISMIGCIYNVVAKILANQLHRVMNGLVGKTQTAFVQGRQILDGALIANEAVHWIKKKKMKAVLIKLDFQKEYDLVRWVFVDQVLEKMGFEIDGVVGFGAVYPLLRCQSLLMALQLSHLG